MKIKQDFIPIGNKRPGEKLKSLDYITIHSTANPSSTAQNERDWLVNPSNTRLASWHIVVDEKEAIQAIPFDEVAFHAGDYDGNRYSVGLEICESGDREKTISNAIKLTAFLLEKFSLDISNLKQHYDWSGKNCPRILRDTNRWQEFVDLVEGEMNMAEIPKWKESGKDYMEQIGFITPDRWKADDVVDIGTLGAVLQSMEFEIKARGKKGEE